MIQENIWFLYVRLQTFLGLKLLQESSYQILLVFLINSAQNYLELRDLYCTDIIPSQSRWKKKKKNKHLSKITYYAKEKEQLPQIVTRKNLHTMRSSTYTVLQHCFLKQRHGCNHFPLIFVVNVLDFSYSLSIIIIIII